MKYEIQDDKKHRVAATIAFFSEIIRFIIIPLVILDVIMGFYPLLTSTTAAHMANNIMIFGGLVALFVALETFFPRGSKIRLFFGILAIATLCAWFWFLLTSPSMSFPFGPLNVSIDITGVALLILAAIALKALIPVAQYLAAKDDARRRMAAAAAAGAGVMPLPPSPAQAVPGTMRDASRVRTNNLEPPPPDDFTMRCPVCMSRIPASIDTCPNCGAWIRQKMNL